MVSEPLIVEQMALLTPASPSSPLVSDASNARSPMGLSRDGQDSKRLVFRGQNVTVTLPEVEPDITISPDEIISRVERIHVYDEEEVRIAWLGHD
jgi:hypothetical protein